MINKIYGFTVNDDLGTKQVKETPKGMGFGELLKNQLDETNDKLIVADEKTQAFIRGEDVEIHDVMVSSSEAKIALQLAIEVRNKLVDVYKEFNNIQI